MSGRSAIRLLAAVTGLVGSACTANLDPIEVDPGCPQQPLRGPEAYAAAPAERLIDDFEDGDLFVVREGGRNGFWVIASDMTSNMVAARASPRCVARGTQSGHFTGSGMTGWGAMWTGTLLLDSMGVPIPFDGRAFSGVSFWAAVADGTPEPFETAVGISTMDTIWTISCTSCMGHYGTRITLTSSWQRFVIRFSDLTQMGMGAPFLFRQEALVGVVIWPPGPFDIWIDDVRFEP